MKHKETVYTVLCVDDEPEGLTLRKYILEAKGYRVLTETNAKRSLKTLSKNHVDLVLLDYNMQPGDLDGIACAKMMHRLNPDLPIILYTGMASYLPEKIPEVTFQLGKAGDPDLLLHIVATILKTKPVASAPLREKELWARGLLSLGQSEELTQQNNRFLEGSQKTIDTQRNRRKRPRL